MLNKNRRLFLNLLPYTLAGGFLYPISKFLLFKESEQSSISIALREIKDGITHVRKSQFFIYKKDNYIDVYSAHCTHMGCVLNFDEDSKQFKCPCHKSRFDIGGKRLKGPAKRDLDRVAFKIKNKTLRVG